ncbi:DUF4168 domain-containing protein [Rhodobacteraceae bacterium 2376]|uniref:DUF4168 domain-containing protein n=1 Tax=Rhabdonatronobacter sediminivivens TaxID=2743469 RepID=A0A7Z0HXG4_9RHOB|nr:DUF4168 domain-containing protein [Rhabdonatronobacter sediminivivens]NYS24090.1 DUF4168 domain-containing protein [Rhabdonatronobacter sediminivivens]
MAFKSTLAPAAVALGMAMGSLGALPAAAQAEASGAEMIEQEQKLDAFIDAAMAVAEVRDAYLATLQDAESEDEQNQIIEAANTAILEAVEETPGITVDEYIAIGDAAAADPELNALLNERFAELHGED